MSNSSLASYIALGTSGNFNYRTDAIQKICIHNAQTSGNCKTLLNLLASTPDGSFHYGIGNDGIVGVYIDERFRAWGTGNPENDAMCVQIMLCTYGSGITNSTYDSLVKLIIDICRRNFIEKLEYTGRPETSNLVTHDMFANVDCPGSAIKALFPKIISEVNAELSHPMYAESETYALLSQSNIVVEAIRPYVVVIDEGVLGINYKDLRTAGVVGVMFCAGRMYDRQHNKLTRYINPSLKAQLEEFKPCYLSNALYCDVRATSVAEACVECNQLYYVVSKYPPKLGLWLHLELTTNDRATNHAIIDKYYDFIVRWGFKAKCGLYCTKEQLSKIDWLGKYCTMFSLWIIAPVPAAGNLPDLQTPNFFKLENM